MAAANGYVAFYDQWRPCVCRLIASKAHGRQPLSHSEIARLSGLKKALVAKLSVSTTWAGQRIEVIDAFSAACKVNHLGNGREMLLLKRRLRRKMMHIFTGNRTQKRFYDRLFRIMRESGVKIQK